MPHQHKTRPGFLGMPPPDEDGPIGSAWIMPPIDNPDIAPEDNRVVETWLLWCPLVHEDHAHWVLAALSMRPSPAVQPPLPIRVQGATHTVVITGVVDDLPMHPTKPGGMTLYDKPTITYQFAATSDEAVKRFLRKVAAGVAKGLVFPEPGPIAGVGNYHAEVLTVMLDEADPAWYITRDRRPNPVLSQQEDKRKTWRINRNEVGTTIQPN